jgi:RES domain-containing protein
MKWLWRISGHCDFEGLGGERTDGRWHTAARGKRIVYFSEHPALALIEALANLKGDPKLFPESYQLMKVAVAGNLVPADVMPNNLSDNWRDDLTQTRTVGDSWLARADSALLAVPSVPSPESTNYLFNPLHRDVKRLAMEWCRWIQYDKRLFHLRASPPSPSIRVS